jgi:hypothetical protein
LQSENILILTIVVSVPRKPVYFGFARPNILGELYEIF